MKLTKSLVCAALLVGVSSAAMADFSGFYIGPQISYTWINSSVTVAPDHVFTTTETSFPTTPDGFTVGPHLGWAFQRDSWVYALEGSYTSGSFTNFGQEELGHDHATFTTKVSQLFTATPVIGYTLDNWLLYGKAGYISAKVNIDSTINASGEQASLSDSQRQNGWTSGLGVAYQLTEKHSIGLEYDYSHLGSTDFTTTTTGAAAVQEQVTVQPMNINTVSMVYTYHFG